MKQLKIALVVALLLAVATFGIAGAQAYQTTFTTSITYQNVGTQAATVQFQFYNQGAQNPVVVTRNLPAGAGSSLFVGGLSGQEALPAGFLGAAVAGSDQPIVATMVQVPNSQTIKVRPLSNGFSSATDKVLLATVLKNQFNTTSKFSIQNADSSAANFTVNLVPTSGATVVVQATNIAAGSAKYFDMGTLAEIAGPNFNGSATITAVKSGTATPANIVGSVMELSTVGKQATAFEGVSQGANTLFVPSALCKLSGTNASTAYAVQNVGNAATDVTVTYIKPGSPNTQLVKNIQPGAKASFGACEVNPPNFGGSAVISGNQPLVAIAKAFADGGGDLSTAFLGEAQGSAKLAMPYVRYTSNANFDTGNRQRTFISVQNVSATPADIVLEYRDKLGNLLGTQTFNGVAQNAKVSSNASIATPQPGVDPIKLQEFGNPESQPDGQGFGGAVIIKATGGTVVAVGRVVSKDTATGQQVGEDYNGIAIQ